MKRPLRWRSTETHGKESPAALVGTALQGARGVALALSCSSSSVGFCFQPAERKKKKRGKKERKSLLYVVYDSVALVGFFY